MDHLKELKLSKLVDLAAAAQSFVNNTIELDVVPQFEKDTWMRQEAEAMAWAADNNAATPMLDIIAKLGGDGREALIRGALYKARRYELLTAAAIGQRRAYAKKIQSADSEEALAELNFIFTVPEGL